MGCYACCSGGCGRGCFGTLDQQQVSRQTKPTAHETWPRGATLEIVSDAEHCESHSNKYRAQESVSCESSRLRVRSRPRLFRFNSDVHAVVDCSNRSRGACCDRMEVRRIL